MEFDYFEYKFSADGAGQARRIAAMLAEQGYHSLQRDALDLLRRYLPNAPVEGQTEEPVAAARTVDVLVPATDRTARILVCERPDAGGGMTVAVVAVGRTPEEANRGRTAAKLALDTKATRESGLAGHLAADNGRARQPRFREEWARALGLVQAKAPEPAGSSPRPLASSQALFALQGAQTLLGRPSLLRSKLGTNGARALDPSQLEGLSTEGLIDRSFVLMCRESGQIVGVGKDAAEVQAAMQLSLRCPHCRRPLSEEAQDVLYSLSPQGEDFIKSTRWMRDAVESSLRRRNCDAVVLSDAPDSRVDGAAYFKDAVLLFRLREGAPGDEDLVRLQQAEVEFEKVAPGVPVRNVIVTAQPAPDGAAPSTGGRAPYLFLNASQLEDSMDRLLEELKRDAFIRLTGTTFEFMRPDPSTLLSRPG
ncbi:MAG: hypothetical protein ACYDAB_02340 [bacterium]